MTTTGLHHVTAIASDPQRNLDFYSGTLGLRLVKRTINFDDPGSYHFYFGDAVGTPGTILTFFPWPHARRGVPGTGEVSATAFAIGKHSIAYWEERLASTGLHVKRPTSRFGEDVISFSDPDGMTVELIAAETSSETQPWKDSPVPTEHALRGFHSVSLALEDPTETMRVLTDSLGYRQIGESLGRVRLTTETPSSSGRVLDLVSAEGSGPGRLGAGSVHHIAFRVSDDAQQRAARESLSRLGFGVSPVMDRTYFHSIYFREPGGVLFEVATDGPGFAIDESVAELGAHLRLPSWMENARERIEDLLPQIQLPANARP